MRIPFPLNLSVGTDIIAHSRLTQPSPSTHRLQRLATRFLHPVECTELHRRFPELQSSKELSVTLQTRIGNHLAGRWAAKEAAKKAWGATLLSFKDLRIEALPEGGVQIICQPYRDNKQGAFKNGNWNESVCEQVAQLSISHDGEYAVATVIATPLHPDIIRSLQSLKDDADMKVGNMSGAPANEKSAR